MKSWTARVIGVLICFSAIGGISPAGADETVELSHRLTLQAQEELSRHRFADAYRLVQRAVMLDPANSEAKDLYMSLYELIDDPENRVIQTPEPRRAEHSAIVAQPKIESPGVRTVTVPAVDVRAPASGDRYVKLGFLYAQGESDYLDYVDSTVRLLGGRAEAGYYFQNAGPSFGLSADYTGYLFKTRGDPRIDILVHRLNVTVARREDFFGGYGRPLVVGVRAGYHLFLLQNRNTEGAYYFRELNGPLVGFFFSEPLFHRFWKNDLLKPMGVEGGINFVPVMKRSDFARAFEYNALLTCDMTTVRVSFGWRSYQIDNGETRERFSGVETGFSVHY
ncbi:MAG: hypothetical protein EPN93_19780 [Spirochaetes bacterium]|nr:MAG: hypothetical protein EPN93_19780 [Spirochaetota bacterium]